MEVHEVSVRMGSSEMGTVATTVCGRGTQGRDVSVPLLSSLFPSVLRIAIVCDVLECEGSVTVPIAFLIPAEDRVQCTRIAVVELVVEGEDVAAAAENLTQAAHDPLETAVVPPSLPLRFDPRDKRVGEEDIVAIMAGVDPYYFSDGVEVADFFVIVCFFFFFFESMYDRIMLCKNKNKKIKVYI